MQRAKQNLFTNKEGGLALLTIGSQCSSGAKTA